MIDNNNEEDVKELNMTNVQHFKDSSNCLFFPLRFGFKKHSRKILFCETGYRCGVKIRKNTNLNSLQMRRAYNNPTSMSSVFMILVLIVFFITSSVVCDSHSSSSVTFPYASATSFPKLSVAQQSESNSSQAAPVSVWMMNSPTASSQAVIMNRSTTLADLIQPSSTRQTPTAINFLQFCGSPPEVANAQSNLMRNQKHHVFPLGQIVTYVCLEGYRPVVDMNDYVNTARCTFPPNLIPNSASNVIFPESLSHETLRSGRSKNSKRLIEIDDEPDANHASPNRVSSIQFNNGKQKTGRSEDFAYDTSPGAFLSGRNSDLENDSDVLEHKKQKIEKTVRNGQRPEWYPSITLKCERVTCNDPGQVEHATRKHLNDSFVYNSNVYYDCLPGYSPVGVPILSCRSNGTWNRSPPKCILKQCPSLPAIENGRILYNDERKIDSHAEYHCNAGFRLNSPTNVRRCNEDTAWSESEPLIFIPNASNQEVNDPFRCIPIECPTPTRPHSGLRILNVGKKKRFSPGDIIIYSCQVAKTRATAKCQNNGEWSREPPSCPQMFSKCHSLPHFPHGQVDIVDNHATFVCSEGYELKGPSSISCLTKGTWNETIPTCVFKEIPTDLDDLKMSQPSRTITIVVLAFFVVVAALAAIGITFFCRWRQNKIQRKRWRQYFGHYHHRQSKTNIVMNRDNLVARSSASRMASRRPRSGSNSTSTQAFLQSSFSSSDDHNADNKSLQTGAGTLTSEQARTMSTFADDCTTTCADDDFEDYEEAENELENLYITSATMLSENNSQENQTSQPMIQLSTPETQSKRSHQEQRPSSVLLDPLYTNYDGQTVTPNMATIMSRPVPAPRVLGPKPSPAVPVTDL